MGWLTWAGIIAAPFTGGASLLLTTADQVHEQQKEQKEAQKKAIAATAALQQAELASAERSVGEYIELGTKQMEAQFYESNIKTLASLISQSRQTAQPQVFTLPAAKSYDPITEINMAIDRLFRGEYG